MNKNRKKIFTVLLIAANILLWGMISYKVIDYFLSVGQDETVVKIDKEEKILHNTSDHKRKDSLTAIYEKLDRDPFSVFRKPIVIAEKTGVQKNVKQNIPVEPFHYNLNGIINNTGNKLAVIQDTKTGETLFLREGDKKENLQIKKIRESEVEIVFYKESMKLIVEK